MQIKNRTKPNFFVGEALTVGYALVTAIIVFILWNKLDNPMSFLWGRIAIISAIGLLYLTASSGKYLKMISVIRAVFPLCLLSFWYSETYEFNRVFPNLDHIFAQIEQNLFGFQPAITFSQNFSNKWISEAFNLGYFSYFPMMVFVVLYCFFYKREQFNRLSFIFLGSFFLYYLLFIFIPCAGPQFYFPVIGMENAEKGIFTEVGNYFVHNIQLLPGPGYKNGLFYQMVELSQAMGERPTAAFPSSHVGISTILMIWLFFNNKKALLALLPLYLLLCGATVYIQAHYLIDVFAGWISAVLFYLLFAFLFDRLKNIRYTNFFS